MAETPGEFRYEGQGGRGKGATPRRLRVWARLFAVAVRYGELGAKLTGDA